MGVSFYLVEEYYFYNIKKRGLFMEYKEYLRKLGRTALEYADLPDDDSGKISLEPVSEENIGGQIEKVITFDEQGNWSLEISKYCPSNIDIEAWISKAPDGSIFDLYIDTNYPQNLCFKGIKPDEKVKTTIKTNTFSKTNITILVHSNKPNTTVTVYLHYSI